MPPVARHHVPSSLTPACFFLIAVAYKLAWTAISSLLSQFSRIYGPEVLLQLNVAYFLPSIPILVAQTALNDGMDRALGSPAAGASARFTAGLGTLVLLMLCFPRLATGRAGLLAVTAGVGTGYGLAFGTSYQLASRFPPVNTVMLTTGFVSSGPVVLLLDLAIKRGTYYTDRGLQLLFTAVAWVTLAGLGAALAVVALNRPVLSPAALPQHIDIGKLTRRMPGGADGSNRHGGGAKGSPRTGRTAFATPAMRLRQELEPLLPASGSGGSGAISRGGGELSGRWSAGASSMGKPHAEAMALGVMEEGRGAVRNHVARSPQFKSHNSSGSRGGWASPLTSPLPSQASDDAAVASSGKASKPELSLPTVALRISPAAGAIFLSVGTSMLVFPFFTYVRSTGLIGERLPQVLFYVRLVGDVAGRQAPARLQARSIPALLTWAAVKTALVPLLFASIFRPRAVGGDVGTLLLVAAFWVLSGYVNTSAYLVGVLRP